MDGTLKLLLKNRYFYIGLIVLVAGIALNQMSSYYLFTHYKNNIPVLRDALLDNLPSFGIAWVYDSLSIISAVLFIAYAVKYKLKMAPYFLLMFGLLQLIRGIFIVMTPFANPAHDYNGFMQPEKYRLGVYPSGHTGASFLAFLLAEGVLAKTVFLLLSIGIVASLLLGRGHYSIDIFSAIIFAYAVYCFGKVRFNRFKLV